MRTANLTLATLLIMRGYEPRLVRDGTAESDHPVGLWEFPDGDGIAAVREQFDQGLAKVEPAAFHRCLTSTRRELFAFLKIGS